MFGVLGFPLYLLRNRGRALALLVVVVLAVMEVSTVALLTGSMLGDLRLTMVAPFQYFTEIVASDALVPPSIAQSVAAQPQTKLLLPMIPEVIRVNTLIGPGTRNVFAVPTAFMTWFLRRIGERLIIGRLPAASVAEIALPRRVMENRHLRLGDMVGQQVDPNEWMPGEFRIVGILGGTLNAGITSYEAMRSFTALAAVPGVASYAAFAQPGSRRAMDAYLSTLPLDQVRVYTEGAEEQAYHQDVRMLDWLLWSINLVTVGVLAVAMGLLNNLYYMQRMDEYGILAAIGFTHGLLLRRAFAEVLAITSISWSAGLGLTVALRGVLARWLFAPHGISLPSLDLRDIVFTLPIPLLISVFTLTTVLRRLTRLDPVSVVERRD